ncbi:unnamed protein product, partial [marine sediment metagenome]
RKAIEAHFRGLIQDNFRPGNIVRIEHVKPEGQLIQLTPGKIRDFEPNSTKVVIKREGLRTGRYDGLGIIKEEGDYAITETQQGSWVVIHSYYSMTDELKGQFYNINTPVEFYPDRIRYVDLHIDVIRWPDGKIKEATSRKGCKGNLPSLDGFLGRLMGLALRTISRKLVLIASITCFVWIGSP